MILIWLYLIKNYKLMEKFLSTAGLIILDHIFGFAIEIGFLSEQPLSCQYIN